MARLCRWLASPSPSNLEVLPFSIKSEMMNDTRLRIQAQQVPRKALRGGI